MFLGVMMVLTWPLGCFVSKETKAITRVGRHMERTHEIDREHNYRKITAADAAGAMYAKVEAIRKASAAISDTAAIKEPLVRFLGTWTSAALIRGSVEDGRMAFMAEVTSCYMKGLVERHKESKLLFPIYKP